MAWLGYLVGGLIGLLILWFVVRTSRVLIRYRLSPAWKWREDVFRLGGAVRQGIEAERQALGQAGLQAAAQDQALRQEAFNGFIAGISVDELDAYPGIGPATITRLRDAGLTNLALLRGASLRPVSLGAKRTGDVTNAVRDLVRQAQGRFNAGACPEAQALNERLDLAHASIGEKGFRALARLRAREEVLEELNPLEETAQQLTFSEYLLSLRKDRRLPLLNAPLPDVEARIRAADEAAKTRYPSRTADVPQHPGGLPERGAPALHTATSARPAGADLFRDAMHKHGRVIEDAPLPAVHKKPSLSVAATAGRQEPLNDHKPRTEANRQELVAILEIDASMTLSADLIRRQYNLMMERYDAEKFKTAGPEFVALATQKRTAALAAATRLLEEFGEKVETPGPAAAAPQEMRHNPDLDAMFGV
jgi:hypothetical protein